MEINDPRVRTEVVDGQVLYFPTPEAWEELEKFPVFGGNKIPVTDIIFPKVKWTSSFKIAAIVEGIIFCQRGWVLLSLANKLPETFVQ
jgi:hypothetical protein